MGQPIAPGASMTTLLAVLLALPAAAETSLLAHRPDLQQVIDQASEYVDGLKTLEIARRMEAAPDFTRRLNTVNGCVVHIDTTSMRSNTLRPAHGLGGATLPVAGLYFGGAGIHPGGGVNGMPGRIAAHRVQRFLGKRSAGDPAGRSAMLTAWATG